MVLSQAREIMKKAINWRRLLPLPPYQMLSCKLGNCLVSLVLVACMEIMNNKVPCIGGGKGRDHCRQRRELFGLDSASTHNPKPNQAQHECTNMLVPWDEIAATMFLLAPFSSGCDVAAKPKFGLACHLNLGS